MSGRRPFSRVRFEALAGYILRRQPWRTGEELAWLMFHSDFRAYRDLGASLTGATYLRGERYPIVKEVGEGWFRSAVRSRLPWWARAGGVLATVYVLARR